MAVNVGRAVVSGARPWLQRGRWFSSYFSAPVVCSAFLLQIDRVGEGLDLMVAVPYLVLYLWCQHLCFKVFLGEFVFVAHRG